MRKLLNHMDKALVTVLFNLASFRSSPPKGRYGDYSTLLLLLFPLREGAGVLRPVTAHIAAGNQINAATECLRSHILKNPIIVRVKTNRAANNRSARHGFQSAHTAYGAIAECLRGSPSEKRALQRFAGLPRFGGLIAWVVTEKFNDIASHARLPATPPERLQEETPSPSEDRISS